MDNWRATRVTHTDCAAGRIGWPCFGWRRPDHRDVRDEPFYAQGLGLHDANFDTMAAALNAVHARFVGISSQGTASDMDLMWQGLRDTAVATGSVDAAGAPLAYEIASDGTGIGEQVVGAIRALAGQVPIDATAEAIDVDEGPTDMVDATMFIDHLEANATGGVADPRDATRICVGGSRRRTPNIDADTFPTRSPTSFQDDRLLRHRPRMNTTIMPDRERADLPGGDPRVGHRTTVLDTREVYFVVPLAPTSGDLLSSEPRGRREPSRRSSSSASALGRDLAAASVRRSRASPGAAPPPRKDGKGLRRRPHRDRLRAPPSPRRARSRRRSERPARAVRRPGSRTSSSSTETSSSSTSLPGSSRCPTPRRIATRSSTA